MVSLTRNDYEPDLCFWANDKSVHFTDETMLHPAPDFVVEMLSKKTAKTDRTVKFRDYAAHSIPEYWLIDPRQKTVEQYWLETIPTQQYALVAKWGIHDQITARSVPGFTIPVAAIFDKVVCTATLRTLLLP